MSRARAAQVIRGLWPDRNPLRRAHDRVEAVVVGVLVVAFLAGAPWAIVTAGRLAYSIGSRTAHAQQITWHREPAVLLTAATPPSVYDNFATASARWTAPHGRWRTGVVPAPRGARAGSRVMVWVDPVGRLAGHPLQPSQVWSLVVAAIVLTFMFASFILLCAAQLARYALDRRRLAAWDADWRTTEPQWTGRR